jgi:hypothetical protein
VKHLLLAAAAAMFGFAGATQAGTTSTAIGTESPASVEFHTDASGATTYWGRGARYEIVGPGITVFLIRRAANAPLQPVIRAVYVGQGWINMTSVTFTVGERIYGPFADVYNRPSRTQVDGNVMVEALVLAVDSDEKRRMLDAMAEADELGRPIVAVLDGDAPYGIELDRPAKRATANVVRGLREPSTLQP